MIFLRRLLLVLWLSAVPLAGFAQAPAVASEVQTLRNLPYVTKGHARQVLDLYLPAHPGGCPLVVWIHGGGWEGGSKERCPATVMLGHGYAVASINYRLSQHAPFPAQIEDCKAAIRWLRVHAAEYGYDGTHIGVWGESAGGHLGALLGVTGGVHDFDVGENLATSSAVQAVVDFYGPTNFLRFLPVFSDIPDGPKATLAHLFGGSLPDKQELARRASPASWVTKDAPPIFLRHGTRDPLVPVDQSEEFFKQLQALKIDVTLDRMEGFGHGGREFFAGEKLQSVSDFLDRTLKK